MAFPVLQTADTQSGAVSANDATWDLTYPTNLVSGDLILLLASNDGSRTWSLPEGWNRAGNVVSTFSAVSLRVAAKISDGTESGTFVMTLSGVEQGVWRTHRITGWFGSGLFADDTTTGTGARSGNGIEVGPYGTGDNSNPDPPNCNPANWDIEDVLWIAAHAADHGDSTTTAWPTDYDAYADVSQESGGAGGSGMGIAYRNLAAASQDPGAFTIDASEQWLAAVIAVRPAGAVAPFLNVDPGSYSLSGIAAGIPASRVVLSSPGSYALSGSDAAVPAGRVLTGIPGSYELTGIDVAFAAPLAILVDPGSYALTGAAAATVSDHILGTEVGVYAVTGEVAAIVAGRAVSADPGTYVLAGTAASLVDDRVLTADLGTYVITGIAADLSLTGVFSIDALPGSYALTGMDALLISDRVLVAAPGVYAVTGISASLIADLIFQADPGAYVLTGEAAALVSERVLAADPAVYSLTGETAALVAERILSLDPGAYALTGLLADLVFGGAGAFEITADSGIYTIAGMNANLQAQLTGGISMGGVVRPSRSRQRREKDEEDEMIALILSRM